MKFELFDIKNKVLLAPMAGVADTAFRLICKAYEADAVISELISAEGLVRQNEKTRDMLDFLPEERPYAIQLFGADPDVLAEAALMAEQKNPDWIDLNFGCPAKNVVKRGAGAALLKEPEQIEKIIKKVKNAIKTPLTVKIRSGWDHHSIVAVDVAKIAQNEGASAITVHGRTKTMGFKGRADWNIIRDVKKAVNIPVIGNGDIICPKDAENMLLQTECDALMIGRGSYGQPWIFQHIHHYFKTAETLREPDVNERINICLKHYKLALSLTENGKAVKEMRKHIGWYVKGIRGASSLRQEIFHVNEPETVIKRLEQFRDDMNKQN